MFKLIDYQEPSLKLVKNGDKDRSGPQNSLENVNIMA